MEKIQVRLRDHYSGGSEWGAFYFRNNQSEKNFFDVLGRDINILKTMTPYGLSIDYVKAFNMLEEAGYKKIDEGPEFAFITYERGEPMKEMYLEELKKEFPLFNFVVETRSHNLDKRDFVVCEFGSGASMWLEMPLKSDETYNRLKEEHAQKVVQKSLMEQYPHLYIHVNQLEDEGPIVATTLWVYRDNRDHEAIATKAGGFNPEELKAWEAEAAKACEPGMFFCSGHRRAEPQSEYAYFYFAGSYCKEWKETHPADYKTAMAETYN